MRITNSEIMRRFPDVVKDSSVERFISYAKSNYGIEIPVARAERLLAQSIDWDSACIHFIDGGRITGRRYW